MFHFQNEVPDWEHAVSALPKDYPVKVVDNVQFLQKIKRVNPKVKTIFRKWYDHGQHFGGNWETKLTRARKFFNTFVDASFLPLAPSIDYLETWNEYLANFHGTEARKAMAEQERAFCHVWYNELQIKYPQLQHIDLILVNVAVGNDISVEFAEVVRDFDYKPLLGYHSYVPVRHGEILQGESVTYSCRFMEMDRRFVDAGIDRIRWMITEAGSVLWENRGGGLHLVPKAGWRNAEALNGSVQRYVEVTKYWFDKVAVWNKANGNRCRMGVLFTTGSWDWLDFETKPPEMAILAELALGYPLGSVTIQDGTTANLTPLERKILRHALSKSYLLEPANAMLQKVAMGESYDNAKLVKTSLEDDVDGYRYCTFGTPHTTEKLHTIYYVPIDQWDEWKFFEVPDQLKINK